MTSKTLSHAMTDFVTALQIVSDQDGLKTAFESTTKNLGFKAFAYHMVKVVGVEGYLPLAVTTYPQQWVQRYIDKAYVSIDPVIGAGPGRLLPYTWDEVVMPEQLDKRQKAFFSEADDFQLRRGMSIPIHGHGGEYALMTLVADGTDREARANIQETQYLLHLMTMYYHNRAGGMLVDQAHIQFKPRITDREKDVLCWTAKGKTARDTAEILGITENTVIFHMENAKQKLNTITRTQAVVKALSLNLIHL